MASQDALDAYSEALAAGVRFLMLHDKTRERPEEGCDAVAELDRLAPVYTELHRLHVAAMKYAEEAALRDFCAIRAGGRGGYAPVVLERLIDVYVGNVPRQGGVPRCEFLESDQGSTTTARDIPRIVSRADVRDTV
ncbi:hypothetical protein F7Q99_28755 [Streptomyces kaniharaensis]|uniref:Uncharacterized protein n=1 Tax=Streptomyces kaniharaensis TaxID=212423 RepID=A0A6N7L0N4_9ACTN|nr:hypothetical protein [Streptomyces kaniharaensis]MQS16118.1 hypothetical protein [Streptomyces kaniharaensis]